MLGCFGQRKKKSKSGGSKQPIDKPSDEQSKPQAASQSQPAALAASGSATKQQQQQQPVVPAKQEPSPERRDHPKQPLAANSNSNNSSEPAPVVETITLARAQSLHQEAPSSTASSSIANRQHPPGIRKAATLGRYDFLKRYDRDGDNDRWSHLKRQYLSPKPSAVNGDGDDSTDSPMSPNSDDQQQQQQQQSQGPLKPRPPPLRVQALPPPKLPLSPGFLANARSLPRQFSPPSTVVSPVKFSNWFHERKTREEEARKECQDREERMQKIIEGPTTQQKEDAAVKIQAGFKGYRARQAVKEKREEQKRAAEAMEKEEAEAAAAAAQATAAAEAAVAAETAATEAAAAAAKAAAAEAAAAAAEATAAAEPATAAEATAAAEAANEAAASELTAQSLSIELDVSPNDAAVTVAADADMNAALPKESEETAAQEDAAAIDDEKSVEAAVKIQAGFRDEATEDS